MAYGSASSPIKPHFFQPLLPGFHNHINIPIAFYSKHIKGAANKGNSNAVAKLRSDVSDLTWEVKMDGRRLTQGWEKFATSHDLRVGDIVIFRHDGDLLFHVTPFGPSCCDIQYNNDGDGDDNVILISSDSEKNHHKQHTKEAGSSSDHSCFSARVTESNLRKDSLFLPVNFSRSNGLMINRECDVTLLNENEKPWTLFLKYYKTNGYVYIRDGWRSFCEANGKRVNDVLTFKLVQAGTKPVLQLRASVYYNRASSTSQDRFVTLTLTPYNLKSYKLCLLVPFVRANGIKNARKVTLVDRYGVRSTTSLKPEGKYGTMMLGKEWIKFCEDNGVKAGESFRLELIKEENTENHLLKFCYTVIYSI